LRELILNRDTDEAVRDHLRKKIEAEELFVPKDERKITNVINQNREMKESVEILKKENHILRD
jgi:hypothetical protein